FLDDIGLGEAGIAPLWTISDQQSARQAVTDYLEETVQRLAKEGVTARSRWVEGPPAEMITATAGEERADLIVMATHGRSGLSKLWLGSVANRVIQRTDLPVLLIRAQEERARAR